MSFQNPECLGCKKFLKQPAVYVYTHILSRMCPLSLPRFTSLQTSLHRDEYSGFHSTLPLGEDRSKAYRSSQPWMAHNIRYWQQVSLYTLQESFIINWLALGLILKPHVFTVVIPHHLETMSNLLCLVLFLHNGHLLSNYYELEIVPRTGNLPRLSFLPLQLPARIS